MPIFCTRTPRATPLALAIACALGALGIGTHPTVAGAHDDARPLGTETWVIANCDDDGAGSLRDTIAQLAGSGDTIDMSQLACGTITLATGAIAVPQEEIFVLGPGAAQLEIDAGKASQVFVHAGHGALLLNGLTVRNGDTHSTTANAQGGCIASQGMVSLFDAAVRDCSARVEGDHNATGGGVYARGGLYVSHSLISGNVAQASGQAQLSGFGVGGGAFTLGPGMFKYSTIDGNLAAGTEESKGQGGGAWVFGGGSLLRSTISNNSAGSGGGILLLDALYGDRIDVESSTISGNRATDSSIGAGLYVGMASQLSILNSTITGNVERNGTSTRYGAGVRLGSGDVPTRIVSSIVSGNFLDDGNGLIPSDIGGSDETSPIEGGHNLIAHALLPVPADTLAFAPQLATLADNGGPTPTHLPLPGSPAIDAGADNGEAFDQRGKGYARLLGADADIGAVEADPAGVKDAIFDDGFELPISD